MEEGATRVQSAVPPSRFVTGTLMPIRFTVPLAVDGFSLIRIQWQISSTMAVIRNKSKMNRFSCVM